MKLPAFYVELSIESPETMPLQEEVTQPVNSKIFDMVLVLACDLMWGIICYSLVCSTLDLLCTDY